jgi:hypothetical protein
MFKKFIKRGLISRRAILRGNELKNKKNNRKNPVAYFVSR